MTTIQKYKYPFIEYKGKLYPVNQGKNSKPLGIYQHIIKAFIDEFDAMDKLHSKLVIIRYDLYFDDYPQHNYFTPFMEKLKPRLVAKYKLNEIAFQYAIETNKNDHKHYHLVLILDGHKIQNRFYIDNMIKDFWTYGNVNFTKDGFYRYERGDLNMKQDIIYHVSYFAKVDTKENNRFCYEARYGISRISN